MYHAFIQLKSFLQFGNKHKKKVFLFFCFCLEYLANLMLIDVSVAVSFRWIKTNATNIHCIKSLVKTIQLVQLAKTINSKNSNSLLSAWIMLIIFFLNMYLNTYNTTNIDAIQQVYHYHRIRMQNFLMLSFLAMTRIEIKTTLKHDCGANNY